MVLYSCRPLTLPPLRQTKYRNEVQDKQRRVNHEEGDRFPLPRLTTYGSVFSIWPRDTPAPPLGEAVAYEVGGAGPMEVG